MDETRSLTRRSFFGVAGALPLALTLHERAWAQKGRRIPIALQLYSLRADAKTDFDATLEKVAGLGFEGVEFAGYFNYTDKAADLRKRLDTLGLKAAGTHIRLDAFQPETLDKTIEFHKTIGCPFLVVPMDAAFFDPEKSKPLAETFNKVAEKLKPLGMACGYHNHVKEFQKDGDKTYWDLFAERTSADVVLQQDCGWTLAAGHDPVAYIKKYPGRTKTTHFKPTVRPEDTGKKAILGQDAVDWKAVYDACVSVGGTRWIVVEQETYPDGKTPLECTRESLAGLKAIVG